MNLLLLVFTVYDSAAKAYLPPFFAPTLEVALRRFRETVNSGDSQIAKYPEDYTLFHIGHFDQSSGELVPMEAIHSLGVAVTFVDRVYPSLEDAEHTVTELRKAVSRA